MPISLSTFIADNKLAPFVLSEMQTDGFLTALAMTPHLLDPSQWLPYFWGPQNDAPFSTPQQIEQYANILLQRCDLQRHALLSNQWNWPNECVLYDENIVNIAVRDYCEGILQGWALVKEQWNGLMPENSAENALLNGVLLSISLLFDHKTARSEKDINIELTQEALAEFKEIFDGIPIMLCGLTIRALELSEQK